MKRIIGGVNGRYMARAYLIGAAFLALMVYVALQGEKAATESAGVIAYFSLCFVLFPFAKLVWDELKALLLGDTLMVLPALIMFPAKLLINALLFAAAIIVAPFGLGYIWLKTK